MTVKCLTEVQKLNICNYYDKANYSIKDLARQYWVSERTISRVLDELGSAKYISKKHGQAYFTKEQWKVIQDFLDKVQEASNVTR